MPTYFHALVLITNSGIVTAAFGLEIHVKPSRVVSYTIMS